MNNISDTIMNCTENEIQVFLATHNRSHIIEKTIESILTQSFESFTLIISDNSTDDKTEKIINDKYRSQVTYIRRIPTISPIDHLNLILSEVSSDYFMIFHDDDIMHAVMLEKLYKKIAENEGTVAVGPNARVVENGKLKRKNFYIKLTADVTINSREQMIIAYMTPAFVPFPGYLYRNEVARQLRFNPEHGGKYCDSAFVIDLLTLGSVIFLANPLMDYYKHSMQDSNSYDIRAIYKLINYITRSSNLKRNHPVIVRYRIQNLYMETRRNLLDNILTVWSIKYINRIKMIWKGSALEYFPRVILIGLYSTIHKRQHVANKGG